MYKCGYFMFIWGEALYQFLYFMFHFFCIDPWREVGLYCPLNMYDVDLIRLTAHYENESKNYASRSMPSSVQIFTVWVMYLSADYLKFPWIFIRKLCLCLKFSSISILGPQNAQANFVSFPLSLYRIRLIFACAKYAKTFDVANSSPVNTNIMQSLWFMCLLQRWINCNAA